MSELANELGLADHMFVHLTSRALDKPVVVSTDSTVRYVDFSERCRYYANASYLQFSAA